MDRLQTLSVFAKVVESGSFSAAAEKLGLSRAAASKQVLQLEEHLGTRLLNRTTRRLSLTEEGSAFYERAVRILAELEEAEREASSGRAEPRGTLRVSAPVSFGLLHLGPALAGFACAHEHVGLTLTLDDRIVDLVEERFDVAIRIGRLADSSLVTKKLCTTRLVLAATPAYWDRQGRPGHPDGLGSHALFAYTLGAEPRTWRFAGPDGKEASVTARGRLAANNGDVLRAAALAGTGVVLLPDFLIGPDLQAGRLEEGMTGWQGPTIGVHAVWPSQRHMTARLRSFVDFLSGAFAGAPSWAWRSEQTGTSRNLRRGRR
jgi:DNA-binding transcriptional LysR family regulator